MYEIFNCDCRDAMRHFMEPQSVHTVITSPPYFGLRDYGADGQIGLEPTPDDFVAAICDVADHIWRVLRDDGTFWLNLGDSYNAAGRKAKELIGIPWRVAFALQARGWYLRQDIIWSKPNPMPESVRDRCTKSHEYLFLLTKSPRYYFDSEAIREEISPSTLARWGGAVERKGAKKGDTVSRSTPTGSETTCGVAADLKRNKRSVWSVATRPYRGAHFATFPVELIEPCVLAGCPAGGVVFDPFGGSGTVAVAALRHGRNALLAELNPDYVALAHARIAAGK